jgi:outer membrane receptor for monomeric catechols
VEFSEQWKALAGLRWEHYESEARTESYATGVVATGPFARTDRMTSGRLRPHLAADATQSYYISAGNSYNPSGELGAYGRPATNLSPGNRASARGEPRLRAGRHWDFRDGHAAAHGDLPQREGERAARGRGRHHHAAGQPARGRDRDPARRHIMPNWEIYSGIAFMRGEIVSGPRNVQGNTPLGVPEAAGNVWTTYRLAAAGKSAAARATTRASGSPTPTTARCRPTRSGRDGRLRAAQLRDPPQRAQPRDKTYYVGGYQNNANRVIPASRAPVWSRRYTV